MAIDLASNLEPVLTQMCRISYNNNKNFEQRNKSSKFVYVLFSDISPKFTLLEERYANGAPSVSVTFPNGHQDNLILDRYDANEEDRMSNKKHCNFIGHLENEPEACVAMTGCFGSEDVHLTILSTHATESRMFTWTKEGEVDVIDKKV